MTDTRLLVGVIAAVLVVSLFGFAMYRATERERVRSIKAWIKDYLFLNHKSAFVRDPSINCSDDSLWPVIVRLVATQTGSRHCLLFSCTRDSTTDRLLSATEELS